MLLVKPVRPMYTEPLRQKINGILSSHASLRPSRKMRLREMGKRNGIF